MSRGHCSTRIRLRLYWRSWSWTLTLGRSRCLVLCLHLSLGCGIRFDWLLLHVLVGANRARLARSLVVTWRTNGHLLRTREGTRRARREALAWRRVPAWRSSIWHARRVAGKSTRATRATGISTRRSEALVVERRVRTRTGGGIRRVEMLGEARRLRLLLLAMRSRLRRTGSLHIWSIRSR